MITFDDGYADNLEHARPWLARHGLPATVFVTAGAVGATREFWWDELERLLLDDRPLPTLLTLEIAGVTHRWELGDAATNVAVSAEAAAAWKPWEDSHPSTRHALYRELYDLLFAASTAERLGALDAIGTWVGTTSEARPSHRALSEHELAELARDALVDIGCQFRHEPDVLGVAFDEAVAGMVVIRLRQAAVLAEVVEPDHLVPGLEELRDEIAVDEPGGAGDEDPH